MTAEPSHQEVASSPSSAASLAQRLRLAVIGAFILELFVQFYLAGRGAFGASSYLTHRTVGKLLSYVTPVILVFTLLSRTTRNWVDIAYALLLLVLFEVQFALADLEHPSVGAFYPVHALLRLAAAASLFRPDLRAARTRAET